MKFWRREALLNRKRRCQRLAGGVLFFEEGQIGREPSPDETGLFRVH